MPQNFHSAWLRDLLLETVLEASEEAPADDIDEECASLSSEFDWLA